jgi:hypothetical protein
MRSPWLRLRIKPLEGGRRGQRKCNCAGVFGHWQKSKTFMYSRLVKDLERDRDKKEYVLVVEWHCAGAQVIRLQTQNFVLATESLARTWSI